MQECYLPTGNEWVSLPTLQACTGALESFSFLHMGHKGLIEQRGGASLPLMTPFFETEGERASLQSLTWGRKSDWIPTFCGTAGSLAVEGMLLAPVGERGFLYQLTVRSTSDKPLSSTFGLEGCWASAWHCVNEDKEIDGARRCYTSLWNDSLIFDMRCGLPLFAFAPMMDQPCSSTFQETDAGIVYRLAHDCTLEPGEAVTVTFYWGVGFEEVAAATSAKEMLRQGWQHELQVTTDWLDARRWPIPDAQLERLYNTNLFFCLFYSAGITLDIPDDQVKENTQIIQMTRFCSGEATDAGFTARYKTNHTRLELAQTVSCRTEGFSSPAFVADTGDGVGVRCTSDASDAPIALEIAARLTSSRDVDPLLQLDVEPGWDFVSALAENQAAWEQKWADCDIVMEGDDDAQTALRYVIYQLAANCSPRDHTVSIGARGLTHTRYKGCYFWDTDLFLTPFYDLTDPKAARSLAGFRVGTLPQARAHAARMNGAGARYPWMVSYDGTEQCESWDIGCSEVHVTADVAYALGQYLDWTGDDSLFFQGGAQVLVETARFWVSRYSPAPEAGKVNLLFCKGPDEYCGITSNNLFTNAMVKHNLSLALTAAARLKKEAPEQYAALSLSKAECAAWEILRDAIQLPRDPITGHYRQDDTFHLLERVEPAELKSGDEASYHQVCFDRLQRYQVIKQADTLLLITRLPEQFTEEEKLAAWEDFEPLCIHDSTLSFASHALFAAQNGLAEAAEAYWRKALYLDLEEVMGNTGKEGLHLACLGETWNTVIFGFAGLHIENGVPKLSPHLPNGLVSMQFHFYYRGQRYEVQIAEGASKIFIAPNKS